MMTLTALSKNRLVIAGLLAICVLAFVIRVLPVLNHPEDSHGGLGPHWDSMLYHILGYNLYSGRGFVKTDIINSLGVAGMDPAPGDIHPAFSRGPVYPLFIAGVYRFFSDKKHMHDVSGWRHVWDRIRIAQSALDAFICILVFFIAREFVPGNVLAGFLASALYCFSFYNIFYTRSILSETLTTFLVTVMIFLSVRWLKDPSRIRLALLGISSAALALCRPEYLLFFPFFSLWVFFIFRRKLRRAFVYALSYLFLILLCLAPWTLRNVLVFGEPILVSVGGLGESLYNGTWVNRSTWTNWHIIPKEVFHSQEEEIKIFDLKKRQAAALQTGTLQEVKSIDRAFLNYAWKRIQARPLEAIQNWIRGMPRLWYQDYIRMYRDIEASGVFFVFYFVMALYAFLTATNPSRLWMAPVLVCFVFLNLIFLPAWIEPRYGVALMPSLISLAAIGLGKICVLPCGHQAKNYCVKEI